jgi:hypothetical protein
MAGDSPPRRPLHERTESDSNSNSRTLRLVSSSPQFLRQSQSDEIFARTPLPTHPSHILLPSKAKGKGKGKDYALQYEFQHASKSQSALDSTGSPVSTTYTLSQPPASDSPTRPATSRPKPHPKKRLHIHKDNKTFSLVPQDDSQLIENPPLSPRSRTLSTKSSYDVLPSQGIAEAESNTSPSLPGSPPRDPSVPASPPSEPEEQASADLIGSSSPWNYQLVGGIRKVPKTPELKLKIAEASEQPPLPAPSDAPTSPSRILSTKPSFRSTETTTTTTSENTNYKVYRELSPAVSEAAPGSSPSGNSNYQLHGDPSPDSSVIYRPQASTSEYENYELHGDPSPSTSSVQLLRPHQKYSQESLVVPPLNPRPKRSDESFRYFKSKSRESLRTCSLTSISTALSQQEAAQAVAGSGALIHIPHANSQFRVADSWAEVVGTHPPRSYMNERPHQWSSQLSTVQSVSEGTDRGSKTWSDDNGRRSSGFPSTPSPHSRHSRQMLSISSSLAREEAGLRSDSVDPPEPALTRGGPPGIGDHDEYGDVITDMRDLRYRPSRARLSGLYSIASSDYGRTSTMQSTGSSRTNSMLASTIPTWARLYYGSGEWGYMMATPRSVSVASDSRANSFRSGSPNTDHFPATLFSPRRRPREINNRPASEVRSSLEITPAPESQRMMHSANVTTPRQFRTWSMSSIWSPHLRVDRRATRASAWGPPSVTWSTEGRLFGRRNMQVLSFTAGFIFPLGMHSAILPPLSGVANGILKTAWMIAAFLPLPLKNPTLARKEEETETPNDFARQFGPLDDARYESARWWRNLNRWMCVVGIIIIVLVVYAPGPCASRFQVLTQYRLPCPS